MFISLKEKELFHKFTVLKFFSKHIAFFILLCCGVFLIPSVGSACKIKTEKTIQIYPSKTLKKDTPKGCLKIKTCNKDKHHNNCKGECKRCSCQCSSAPSSWSLFTPIALEAANNFADIKKQKFDFKYSYYSSGYYSIWQPPKIG